MSHIEVQSRLLSQLQLPLLQTLGRVGDLGGEVQAPGFSQAQSWGLQAFGE